MPEIFRFFGIRFFYFSNDHLPVHVHIKTSDGTAKFEIEPLVLIENKGVKMKKLSNDLGGPSVIGIICIGLFFVLFSVGMLFCYFYNS